MREIKDTQRATVRIGYDGRVHKTYRGPDASDRYENELRVLRYLEKKECPFVPKLLEWDDDELNLVTTNCGSRVEDTISKTRTAELYKELERDYGVRHDDPFARNITYDPRLGRFCIIDFEYAVVLETGEGLLQPESRTDHERKR